MFTPPPSGLRVHGTLRMTSSACTGAIRSSTQESNLRFALSAAPIARVYLGDAFSFALYAMASQPEIRSKIQMEADALFENGDPDG